MASILESPEILESAYNSAKDSEGSAQIELNKYLESTEGRIAQFTNKVQDLTTSAISDELVNGFIDLGTTGVTALDAVIDKLGLLPTLMSTIGAGLSLTKNVGKRRSTMFHNCFEYADRDRCSLYKIGFLSPIVKYTLVNEATISVEII